MSDYAHDEQLNRAMARFPVYDRDGRRMPYSRYIALRYGPGLIPFSLDYWSVAQDHVGAYHVSTVWLGLDHGLGHREQPSIFETMVFLNSDSKDVAGLDHGCWRYATEEEALQGHRETCILIEVTVGIPVVDEAEMNQVDSRNGDDDGGACV